MLEQAVQAATYAMGLSGILLASVILVYIHSDARPE